MTSTKNDSILLKIETVSAVFAHDISTPLTTAQLNANLLAEHCDLLREAMKSEAGSTIPVHLQAAIERAPELIAQNLKKIQTSVHEYKTFLNDLNRDENTTADAQHQVTQEVQNSPRLRILLVDDEEIHHDIGDAVLGVNHEIAHESSGTAAIERCKRENFDVILMDMQMPLLPGPQTTEKLRTFIPQTTLIIGLTNMPIEGKKSMLLSCGYNGFLDKPLKLRAFNALVNSLFATKEQHRADPTL